MTATRRGIAPRIALCFVLTLSLSACSAWRSQWDHPHSVLERAHPDQVRVVREDGSETVLRQPRVAEDTITGETERGTAAIPLSEVNHLDVKRRNSLMPALLVSTVLLGGMLGLLAATWE